MPLRKDRYYEYMPASLDTLTKGAFLGSRQTTNNTAGYKFVEKPRLVLSNLPDRQVGLGYSVLPSFDRHLDLGFDQVVDLDLFLNKRLVSEYGYTFGMINSSSVPKKFHSKDYDHDRSEDDPIIVADSGGFQLSSGASDFIDPHKIIAAHNATCDRGMVLDIPIVRTLHKKLLPRAARIQKLNNEIFLKNKRESLRLVNVFHGNTFYLRQKYRDVVETDDFKDCAIGGLKVAGLLDLSLQAIKVMMTGKKYEQYHILGASGLERWVAIMYIAHKKVAKLITSDSTSYIQGGVSARYYLPYKLHKDLSIGDIGRKSNYHRLLPCSCPSCNLIKYLKPTADKASFSARHMILHNLWVHARAIDELYELTAQPKKEILAYLKHYIGPAKLKDIMVTLNAIDLAVDESPEKAAKKHAPYLLEKFSMPEGAPMNSLFSKVDMTIADSKIAAAYKRLNKVLETYERFHGI